MIVDWMVYALAVSVLLGLAALAAERSLKHAGRPVRWVWLGALWASVVVPALEWFFPGSVTASFPSLTPDVISLPAVGVGVTEAVARGSGLPLGSLALAVWTSASAALLVYTLGAALALRGRRTSWRSVELDGVRLLVSRDAGPAALGLWRGVVVVPEWVLALDAPRRRMLVAHEHEHVKAADPALQAAGLLGVVVFPWNPVMWWLLARLRLAIEVDCDARVLRGEDDARAYGTLLLEMGRHRSGLRLAAVALAEPASMLERRIRVIGRPLSRSIWKAAVLAALAGVVVALACEAPAPTEGTVLEAGSEHAGTLTRVRTEGSLEASATCQPRVMLNGVGIEDLTVIEELDPATIERVQVIGKARAMFHGDTELTLNPGCGTILVTTNAGGVAATRIRQYLDQEAAGPRGPVDPDAGPQFTPYTDAPELQNIEEVVAALRAVYPPLLKDAGIGGVVHVWFYIDERGLVTRTQINQSSGREELDRAALRLADVFRFEPALNGEEPVPVWVSIPIVFQPN